MFDRNHPIRNHPIVFILTVLCSLGIFLVAREVYSDQIWQTGGRLTKMNSGKISGIEIGGYNSKFVLKEVPEQEKKEIRKLESETRRILGISDELYADIETQPKVKIFEYENKNWQYWLCENLPCGFQTYEGTQGVILLEKSIFDNPERRKQTYVHEYIHFLSNQGTALMVKEGGCINTALTEAYTEMLCQKVLKELNVKYIFKTRYEKNIPIARRMETASNGVTTKIFFRFSKVNFLADSLPEYREFALLAKRREDRVGYYPHIMKEQKRVNEILDSYESETIWQ